MGLAEIALRAAWLLAKVGADLQGRALFGVQFQADPVELLSGMNEIIKPRHLAGDRSQNVISEAAAFLLDDLQRALQTGNQPIEILKRRAVDAPRIERKLERADELFLTIPVCFG